MDVERPTVLLTICDGPKRTGFDGFNVGNRFFVGAAARHLRYDYAIGSLDIRPKIGTLLLPFPNFIRSNDDLAWLESYIKDTDASKVVLLCGGIQKYEGENLNIPLGAVRVLKSISDKSDLLGVRGDISAEVINDIGIKNVKPIGCPSMHWWMDPLFKIIDRPKDKNRKDGVTHLTPDGNFSDEMSELFAVSIINDWFYVIQDEFYFASLLGRPEVAGSQDHLEYVWRHYRAGDIDATAFRGWISNRAVHFPDCSDWIRFFRDKQFSIGTRLHGSVAAILAGTPARILWHDLRVKEVADYFSIPLEPFAGQERHSISAAIPGYADMEKFNKNYAHRFVDYTDFLIQNGLDLSSELQQGVAVLARGQVGAPMTTEEGVETTGPQGSFQVATDLMPR